MRYDLNPQELRMCQFFAKARRANAVKHNVDLRYSKRDPHEIEFDGFMGELLTAKHLNFYPDFTLNEKKTSYDLVSHSGLKIDVKTTRNKNKSLSVKEHHRKTPCDIYIYLLCDDAGAEFLGWVDKTEFWLNATINKTYGNYELAIERLNNIKEF